MDRLSWRHYAAAQKEAHSLLLPPVLHLLVILLYRTLYKRSNVEIIVITLAYIPLHMFWPAGAIHVVAMGANDLICFSRSLARSRATLNV